MLDNRYQSDLPKMYFWLLEQFLLHERGKRNYENSSQESQSVVLRNDQQKGIQLTCH